MEKSLTSKVALVTGASKGITINAIAPGPVNKELFKVGKTEEQITAISNANSFGRLGEPEDISQVVLFLASRESQWVTGQTMRVEWRLHLKG
ncbi:Enoyl-(Acyl carrier protein) reductase [Paenibacillus algorifonticola]|uniref:Enoyl-(Acyl carrier protein) reductase n=1 Tax=Paenibacillus algorifonticola TaxID=684063 RepID=A0A1I2FLS3_9BACL|nr:Enoyl-(Acyl carrier protein) reductase [Paenibacillus algorifonticola]